MLPGRIGPEDPFPIRRATANWVAALDPELRALRRPAFVQLGADPALSTVWTNHGFGLLDFDEACRLDPGLPGWYALRWRGGGYLRQVRLQGQTLEILGQRILDERVDPEAIEIGETSLLQTIRAQLVWVGPDPLAAGWRSQSGFWLPRAACS